MATTHPETMPKKGGSSVTGRAVSQISASEGMYIKNEPKLIGKFVAAF